MIHDHALTPDLVQTIPRRDIPVWVWFSSWTTLSLCICLIGVLSAAAFIGTRPTLITSASPTPPLLAWGPANWKSVLSDSFVSNQNGWDDGEKSVAEGDVRRSIDQYAYHWDVFNRQDQEWYAFPDVDMQLADQYVTVDTSTNGRLPSGAYYGLLIRYANPDNFYEVKLSDGGYWGIDRQVAGEWHTLVAWTRTPYLTPQKTNHLAVLAEGSRITVFVNDHYQGGITDDQIPRGKPGLVVGADSGERTIIDFDNFEVETP